MDNVMYTSGFRIEKKILQMIRCQVRVEGLFGLEFAYLCE